MRRFFFITILLVFATQGLQAQKTTISGTAPGAEGKKIILVKFSDLITFEEIILDSAIVDSTGKFTLDHDLAEPVYVSVSIDFHKVEMFLEPGREYGLIIAPQDYNNYKEINPLLQSQNLQAEIKADLDDLNIQVNEFNAKYDQFILSNFEALYRERNKAKLDSFRVKVSKQFESSTSPYFTQYVRYKLASIEQLTQALTQAQLAKKYFIGQPVLYENLEYMDFFNSFFAKYMTVTSRILHKVDYLPLLKGPEAYDKIMKTMNQDTLLKDVQVRELVMLKGMMELFNTTGYPQEEVIQVIRTAQSKLKFAENRTIAIDMEKHLMNLKPGTMAPVFTLTDLQKKKVSLKSLRGKPVLLSFWTTYCPTCLTQLDIMKTLYEKYKDRFYFVSISADRDFIRMRYFLEQKKDYSWIFLHLGDQFHLLKDYDVRSFPLFVLIDMEGVIYKYPADFPESGLEASMEKMFE
ncbi:MAG: TlpA disulfide reductase family protein [bacterium]